MAKLNIRGAHESAQTGKVYKYRVLFEGYGPDIFFKAQIPIAERGKVLHVERVICVDLTSDNAVDAVHREMKNLIDHTDFETVECD
jgi:hypothetical protein